MPPIVITFNLEYGAERYGVETAAKFIASTRARVALLQETQSQNISDGNSAAKIASILGWYFALFDKSNTAIIAAERPIVKISEGAHFGVGKIDEIYYCVIHLSDYPYIPFEASGIKYPPECPLRGKDACFRSSDPRVLEKRSFDKRKEELKELAIALTGIPVRAAVIAGGDFNEPSHLDWTQAAAAEGRIPFAIEFPSTRIMEELGFKDAFREAHPDPLVDPGYTWPAREIEYESRRDRIDFIFVKNLTSRVRSLVAACRINPSDHAAVAIHGASLEPE